MVFINVDPNTFLKIFKFFCIQLQYKFLKSYKNKDFKMHELVVFKTNQTSTSVQCLNKH